MLVLFPEDYDNQIFEGLGIVSAKNYYDDRGLTLHEQIEPFDWSTTYRRYGEFGDKFTGFHFFGIIVLFKIYE